MSGMPLTDLKPDIRRACHEDGESIKLVNRMAFAGYHSGSNSLDETLFDIYRDIEENTVLVIELEQRIVGSLRLEFRPNRVVYLKRFSILPGLQHQGLGTLLYHAAQVEVISRGGLEIYLYSSLEDYKLVKFYRKLGFRCVSDDKKYGYSRGKWFKSLKEVD